MPKPGPLIIAAARDGGFYVSDAGAYTQFGNGPERFGGPAITCAGTLSDCLEYIREKMQEPIAPGAAPKELDLSKLRVGAIGLAPGEVVLAPKGAGIDPF